MPHFLENRVDVFLDVRNIGISPV